MIEKIRDVYDGLFMLSFLWCLFMLSYFPRDVLDEILDLIEPVCGYFPTYSYAV